MGDEVLRFHANGWVPVEDDAVAYRTGIQACLSTSPRRKGCRLTCGGCCRRESNPDARSVIATLADQVAIAIDDSRLMEENVRLERELAERERLASLGRMAADGGPRNQKSPVGDQIDRTGDARRRESKQRLLPRSKPHRWRN